jgi:hypothetical protein
VARIPISTEGCIDTLLLDFVFAFSARSGMFDSLLRFGFFHGSLGFGGTFGAGLSTLLALFVEDFFAAEEFDESVIGAIAFSPSSADDAEVAAVAIAETRSDGVEKFVDGGASHEVRQGLAAGC